MGRLMGTSIDNVRHSVIYILFVNDCFIVTRATIPETKTMWLVIERYCALSG